MDKELIIAVAGSGKTSLIVSKLNLEERFLLITYTINNTRNLKRSIIKKFGYSPSNIELYSYYNFLYSFCLRPFLAYKIRPRGIFWEPTPKYTDNYKLDHPLRYMTKGKMLYHNRIAKLLDQCEVLDDINNRLAKYYDHLLIDEVQDFAGHDFNLLTSILKCNINILLVGDFYQHTFDTSRDGRTNSTLHDDFNKYQERFSKQKVTVNSEYLNKSHRCTKSVCEFITSKLGIEIESHKLIDSRVVFVEDNDEIKRIYEDDSIIKLFYRENYKYQCYSRNWGDCKGENHYYDVCVVLNNTSMSKYEQGKLNELKPISKNKLYVACSRANNNLFLINESEIKHLKK
ncbi:MAG: AAA family ATPase [Flavobacteriia bacterium]|nr:AAA family ATPase [Bacteroidota bacterium]NCT17239.1 AAA family ATPase [Flavobacteriia bacterium]